MSIANELSSDVASAVLAHKSKNKAFDAERLIEIIRNFHSALRDLSRKERSNRLSRQTAKSASQSVRGAAAGSS